MSIEWHTKWVHHAGSIVIITGAGSGIGMATALLAVSQGYRVSAWDIVPQGLEKLKEHAGHKASMIYPTLCDIASKEAVEAGMAEVVAQLGKPHMLVNNAGPVAIGTHSGFMDMMTAAMGMIHYITDAFLATKPDEGSSIVNISSVVGPLFGGGGTWYSAAKAAIAGLTKNLAVTLQGSTRVNSVAPGGPVRTPRNTKFIDDGTFKHILSRNPSKRPGSSEELANGIMFLLSPAASYINGHMLVIDGGLSIAE